MGVLASIDFCRVRRAFPTKFGLLHELEGNYIFIKVKWKNITTRGGGEESLPFVFLF